MSIFGKSLRTTVTVRGYKLERLPLGGYLNAIERLQELPGGLLQACFPGAKLDDIFDKLKNLDEKTLTELVGNAMTAAPQYAIKALAELTGIPEEKLLRDQQIGLDGLAEIVEAFWKLNGLENFMAAIRRMAKLPLNQSFGSRT
jgi:hypothetical protein